MCLSFIYETKDTHEICGKFCGEPKGTRKQSQRKVDLTGGIFPFFPSPEKNCDQQTMETLFRVLVKQECKLNYGITAIPNGRRNGWPKTRVWGTNHATIEDDKQR